MQPLKNKNIKDKLELNEKSNVLLMGCEGDADENLYKKLLNEGIKQLKKIYEKKKKKIYIKYLSLN